MKRKKRQQRKANKKRHSPDDCSSAKKLTPDSLSSTQDKVASTTLRIRKQIFHRKSHVLRGDDVASNADDFNATTPLHFQTPAPKKQLPAEIISLCSSNESVIYPPTPMHSDTRIPDVRMSDAGMPDAGMTTPLPHARQVHFREINMHIWPGMSGSTRSV